MEGLRCLRKTFLRGVSRNWRRGVGVGEVGVDDVGGSLMLLAMAGYFVVQVTVVWFCSMYGWCSIVEQHELIEQGSRRHPYMSESLALAREVRHPHASMCAQKSVLITLCWHVPFRGACCSQIGMCMHK